MDASLAEAEALVAFIDAIGLISAIDQMEPNLCKTSKLILCTSTGYRMNIEAVDKSILPETSTHFELPGEYLGQLKHLDSLVLPSSNLGGTIPEELGSVVSLEILNLAGNAFTGSLPSSLTNLTRMVKFDVSDNQLVGSLDRNLFTSWENISIVDMSGNGFEGLLPDLDFGQTPSFRSLDVSSNAFTGMRNLTEPDDSLLVGSEFASLDLDMSSNQLTVMPSVLKRLRRLSTLNLRDNAIVGLPIWGNYNGDAVAEDFVYSQINAPYSTACFWSLLTDPFAREPPRWPGLKRVDLSLNPLGASLRDFLALFAYGPSLASLRCSDCGLTGVLPSAYNSADVEMLNVLYRFRVEDDGLCTWQTAYENLEYIDVSSNTAIEGCDFIDVLDTDNDVDNYETKVRCGTCPSHSEEPGDGSRPMPTGLECVCQSGFEDIGVDDSGTSRVCTCPSNHFYVASTDSCTLCGDEFDCDNIEVTSEAIPPLAAGYWMPCVDQSNYSLDLVYSCFSIDTCVGGEVDVSANCSTDAICGAGRGGQACSRCLPGFYGGADGECLECLISTSESRWRLVFWALVAVPFLLPPMMLLSNPSNLGRFKLLKQLKSQTRILLRHVSLLGVLSRIEVNWPLGVNRVFDFCSLVTAQLDLALQTGCWSAENAVWSSLLVMWCTPFLGVLLVFVASILSRFVGWVFLHSKWECLVNQAKFVRQDWGSALTFCYMLWAAFFSTLTTNALVIFTLRQNPNGHLTVYQLPDVEIGTEEYTWMALACATAFLVYVVFFFAVSFQALRHVGMELRVTNFTSRGPFEFVTDGLRVGQTQWNIYASFKDVLVALAVVAFVSQPMTQLLLTATILLLWAWRVSKVEPFESWTTNVIEVWSSGGAAGLLIIQMVYADRDHEAESQIWQTAFLFVSVLVPAIMIVLEVASFFPSAAKWIPGRIRAGPRPVESEVDRFERIFSWHHVSQATRHMDSVEWKKFLACLGLSGTMLDLPEGTTVAKYLDRNFFKPGPFTDAGLSSALFRLEKSKLQDLEEELTKSQADWISHAESHFQPPQNRSASGWSSSLTQESKWVVSHVPSRASAGEQQPPPRPSVASRGERTPRPSTIEQPVSSSAVSQEDQDQDSSSMEVRVTSVAL